MAGVGGSTPPWPPLSKALNPLSNSHITRSLPANLTAYIQTLESGDFLLPKKSELEFSVG
jgi:hypothetical protein